MKINMKNWEWEAGVLSPPWPHLSHPLFPAPYLLLSLSPLHLQLFHILAISQNFLKQNPAKQHTVLLRAWSHTLFSGTVGIYVRRSQHVWTMLVTSKRPLSGAKVSRHFRKEQWVLRWITGGGLQAGSWATEVSEQRGEGTWGQHLFRLGILESLFGASGSCSGLEDLCRMMPVALSLNLTVPQEHRDDRSSRLQSPFSHHILHFCCKSMSSIPFFNFLKWLLFFLQEIYFLKDI